MPSKWKKDEDEPDSAEGRVTYETYLAVGKLVQAAAHQHGIVGPVPFTVSKPRRGDRTPQTFPCRLHGRTHKTSEETQCSNLNIASQFSWKPRSSPRSALISIARRTRRISRSALSEITILAVSILAFRRVFHRRQMPKSTSSKVSPFPAIAAGPSLI